MPKPIVKTATLTTNTTPLGRTQPQKPPEPKATMLTIAAVLYDGVVRVAVKLGQRKVAGGRPLRKRGARLVADQILQCSGQRAND